MKTSRWQSVALATLLVGCGVSETSFDPGAAQAAPLPEQAQALRYVVPLDGRPGESLNLSLTVKDGDVTGEGFLARPNDVVPLGIRGQVESSGTAILRLFPDDVGASESYEWSGNLSPGSTITLTQPGLEQEYATGTVRASSQARNRVFDNFSGDAVATGTQESYEFFVTGLGFFQGVNLKYKLVFERESGPDTRIGTIQLETFGSRGQRYMPLPVQRAACEAHFWPDSPWVSITFLDAQKGRGVIWVRPTENADFANGKEGAQVSVDGDSYIEVPYRYFTGTAINLGLLRPESGYLKLLAGGYTPPPKPSPTPVPLPTPTPTPTPVILPSPSPLPLPTPTPVVLPSPSPSPAGPVSADFFLTSTSLVAAPSGMPAGQLLASANGRNFDGNPNLPLVLEARGLAGALRNGGATEFELFVDGGIQIASATQLRVSYDLTGDGSFERVETYVYWPNDDVIGYERYTEARQLRAVQGTLGDLRGGTVRVEVWSALGQNPTTVEVNGRSKVRLPYDGLQRSR